MYSVQTILASPTASTSPTGKSIVVDIIGRSNKRKLVTIIKMIGKGFCTVSAMCTTCNIDITKPSFIHTGFYTQVEYCFLFTILYTCSFGHVRLFIVRTQFVNYINRKIFQSNIRIVGKEFLTVYHDFCNLLTVNGYLSLIINFRARQFLYKFFECRTLRNTICR